MSASQPSPPTPSRSGHPLPVEALQEVLGELLREREVLRRGADQAALELNRLQIGALQRQISLALAAQFGG
jgi:hypothetical protein